MVQYTRILISCILKINILWHFIWVDFSREEILRSEEPFFYLSIICHPRNGLWFSESFFVNIQKWKCLLDQHRTLLHCKILNICLWKCLRERFISALGPLIMPCKITVLHICFLNIHSVTSDSGSIFVWAVPASQIGK